MDFYHKRCCKADKVHRDYPNKFGILPILYKVKRFSKFPEETPD